MSRLVKWIIGLQFLLTVSLSAQELSLRVLEEFLNDPSLQGADVSMAFLDAKNGEAILTHQPNSLLVPASSHKLLVSSTILNRLGADFRYRTYLEYTGTLSEQGVLNGNLIIRGSGDPSLGTGIFSALSLEAFTDLLLTMVKREGIKSITGGIYVDDNFFSGSPVSDTWERSDVGNYYGAGVWGFNIHNNLYYLDLLKKPRGQRPGIKGTRPSLDGLSFSNKLKCAGPYSGDNAYIYGGPDVWDKEIKGSIPSGNGVFTIKGSMPNPPFFYAKYFEQKLKAEGILAAQGAMVLNFYIPLDKRLPVFTHFSPPLSELVKHANLESDNMYCETFLKTLGTLNGGKGSREEGIAYLKKSWLDWGLQSDPQIFDGSGLSRSNRLSSIILAKVLQNTLGSDDGDLFYSTLPKSGTSGTLGKIFKNSPEQMNLSAKTGSMRSVRSLTGVFETKSGKKVVFSIIINRYNGSGYDMWKKMESFLTELYHQS